MLNKQVFICLFVSTLKILKVFVEPFIYIAFNSLIITDKQLIQITQHSIKEFTAYIYQNTKLGNVNSIANIQKYN